MQPNSKKVITIAMADNHSIFLKGMVEIIDNFENIDLVMQANSTDELITGISNAHKLPDVLLIGINLIKFNQYTGISKLKERYPDTKILVLSVYDHEFNIIRLLQAGANGFLSKNVAAKELQRAILSVYYTGMYTETAPAYNKSKPFITETEAGLLKLLASDISDEEIADQLNIKPGILESYKNILCEKLNVNSRIGLIISAYMMGISGNENATAC